MKKELDSASILGETRVRHADMLEAWLDAAPNTRILATAAKHFNEMVGRLGKTMEGISWFATERLAESFLDLDDVARRALGEDPVTPTEQTT